MVCSKVDTSNARRRARFWHSLYHRWTFLHTVGHGVPELNSDVIQDLYCSNNDRIIMVDLSAALQTMASR